MEYVNKKIKHMEEAVETMYALNADNTIRQLERKV